MEAKDLLFTPIYLLIIYAMAYVIRPKLTDKVTFKYFIPALTLKIIGAIALGLIYQYYYQYGDTLRYHFFSEVISDLLIESPKLGMKILFSSHSTEDYSITYYLNDNYFFRRDAGGFLLLKLCGVIGVLCSHSYYTISVMFAFIGFIGGWYLFKVFYELYPKMHKTFFYTILCIPSVIFWGSGILKDTITLSSIGILTYIVYKVLISKQLRIVYLIVAFVCIYFIITLKIYIILCFLPSAMLWAFGSWIESIRSLVIRYLIAPISLFLMVIGTYFAVDQISSFNKQYSFENLERTVHVTSDWIAYSSGTEGSYYSLGDDFELSLIGVLEKLPQGVNVTLFRPYLWEVKNTVMLVASLESLTILLLTIYAFYKVGFFGFFRIIYEYPITQFLFTFSIGFAFAVGISTYNFGTLVRYKIPCIPFFVTLLFIVIYLNNIKKQELQSIDD